MAPDLSPTARALRMLEILRSRPVTTAAELADRLGVTDRAVRRYVDILREAGVPVHSTRGRYGGYHLGQGTRLPPVDFQQAEALSLVMAVLSGPGAAAGDDGGVGRALDKVIAALPEAVGQQATILREHASAAPDRSASRPGPATTGALVAAVSGRRRVRITYTSAPDRTWEEEVDPWAVVVRHGRWYLLCHSHRAEEVRTYRVDRVGGVAQTGTTFAAPEGLDPVAALDEHLGTGWEHPVRVAFDAPLAEVGRWVRAPMGRLEPQGSGCVLTGSTSNPRMYAGEWLAAVPLAFRVEGGPELRAAVGALADRLSAALRPVTDGAG